MNRMTTLKSPKATLCWARLGHLGQLDRNEHPDPVNGQRKLARPRGSPRYSKTALAVPQSHASEFKKLPLVLGGGLRHSPRLQA